METEIVILGHKAKIDSISGQPKLEPFLKEDYLAVWLSFAEAVDGTLSFAIDIPAKKYANQAELLYNIRRRGEEALKGIIEKDGQYARERQEKAERQKILDALAAEAQSLLE